ncbi:nucleotidyltransferase family protein [Patescibacteria group bacterium]|nr:nucleotidyltransferase family protein [Patescibacteria group bacterium]
MTDIIQNLQQDSSKHMYQKHGISYLGLFGSIARGEDTIDSDVDLLIDFNEPKSLFDLADVKIYFQDILGRKVDLAMKGKLKKILEPYIRKDLITIYEKN